MGHGMVGDAVMDHGTVGVEQCALLHHGMVGVAVADRTACAAVPQTLTEISPSLKARNTSAFLGSGVMT